jgi:hypothetical protein
MVVYGPPVVVARPTLLLVAPELAFQVRATCWFPAVAVRPVGAAGGAVGVAVTWLEFALVPAEFAAETT